MSLSPATVQGVDPHERWLVERIEAESQAFANADATTRALRLGRVYAYLEVGAAFGY